MTDFPQGFQTWKARQLGEQDNGWMKEGACRADDGRNSHLFFNERRYHEAKKFCDVCPVEQECLAWAIATHQQGFWGGRTYSQRRNRKRNPQQEMAGSS